MCACVTPTDILLSPDAVAKLQVIK